MCTHVPADELRLRHIIVVDEQKDRTPCYSRSAVPRIRSAFPPYLNKLNLGADRCKVLERGWLMTVTLVNDDDFERRISLRLQKVLKDTAERLFSMQSRDNHRDMGRFEAGSHNPFAAICSA
jgi:hypothetical protein